VVVEVAVAAAAEVVAGVVAVTTGTVRAAAVMVGAVDVEVAADLPSVTGGSTDIDARPDVSTTASTTRAGGGPGPSTPSRPIVPKTAAIPTVITDGTDLRTPINAEEYVRAPRRSEGELPQWRHGRPRGTELWR
jgi:hypothetical protein